MRMPLFVLVHSALVGPYTWEAVAQVLRGRGVDVIVPALSDDAALEMPLWQQHARQIAAALAHVPFSRPLVWVGHSGACPRLPVYRQAVVNPAAGYVFVDGGIPHDVPPGGSSQLDMMRNTDDDFADALQVALENGERFPAWTDDMLRDEIPDAKARAHLLAGLQPHGLRYFDEPIPVPAIWPDAPCRYIHFSASYYADATHARRAGWPVTAIKGGHFYMLIDPKAVTDALLSVIGGQETDQKPGSSGS